VKGLSYDALFPTRFIKAGEMRGKPVTLTIAAVYLEQMEREDGTEKPQAIVGFHETKREWALNRTNGQCLRAMFGDDSGEWIGKHVTLVPEPDSSGLSESGLCIRVKGSPDIDQPIRMEIRLPRKRPQPRTLLPTIKGGAKGEDAADGVFADSSPQPAPVPLQAPAPSQDELDDELDEQDEAFIASSSAVPVSAKRKAVTARAKNLDEVSYGMLLAKHGVESVTKATSAECDALLADLQTMEEEG